MATTKQVHSHEMAQCEDPEETYSEAVLDYARYLGIDPVGEAKLLWIAQEGLDAPLPPQWSAHYTPDGTPYFFDQDTNTR